jgi:hypothetical protein
VLIDPGIIARLGAVRTDAFKAGPGILMERPAFRAMIAGRLGPVQRTLALLAIELADMAARKRSPDDAFAVDVGAAVPARRGTL